MALRWGIASAGKISNDFAVGLSVLPKTEHVITAVAARDTKRAAEFAKTHGISKSYGSYEELAKDPEIDVVYIGSVNPEHLSMAKLMLSNGKHVLCEKPLCMNEKESKQLVAFAKQKKLFLMEAIWSRFFPAYQYLRKQVDSGVLGKIESVDVNFGFELVDVDRLQLRSLGGGTVLDLGVYTIQVCQWALKEAPLSVEATGELNKEGVDVAIQAKLKYPNGGVGTMKTSSKACLENKATIKGSKGTIVLNNFWCPTSLIDVDGVEKTWELPVSKMHINFINSVGLNYEAIAVRDYIRKGKTESIEVPHNESLIIARIQDSIRKQVGVVFPQDD